MLLNNRGLSINAAKSDISFVAEDDDIPHDIDEMKIKLLQRRREQVGMMPVTATLLMMKKMSLKT